jgi:hypothetical protein
MVKTKRIAVQKIRETHRAMRSAWWVFLLIAVYSVLASRFLGTACLLASTTGLPCPGCGGTRAVFALLRGDFLLSLRMQPMLIPSAVILCVYFIGWVTHEKPPQFTKRLVLALMFMLAGAYAVRLLWMFPRVPPMVINERGILPRLIALLRRA